MNTSNLETRGLGSRLSIYFLFEHHAEKAAAWVGRGGLAYPLSSPTGAGTNSSYTSIMAVGGPRPEETDSRRGSRAAGLPTVVRRPKLSSHTQECLLRRGRDPHLESFFFFFPSEEAGKGIRESISENIKTESWYTSKESRKITCSVIQKCI